jgi:hypothetical protein
MVVPEWIRSVRNGQVELLAGQEPGEPTYVTELFLRPNYTETTVTETAALWFLTILTSRDGGFHTLIKEAHHLNNPAVVTKIYHYRRLEDERTKLTCELNCILDVLASICNQLNGCHFCMEWVQLPILLRHLEDRNSFAPSIANVNRHHRNTC